MSSLTLEQHNRAQVAEWLNSDLSVIACLCAAWCDTCTQYRSVFQELSLKHPDKHFVWIDIEDQADTLGDIDVENFPTLLIQQGDAVAFYGTVLPDMQLADRLIQVQCARSKNEIQKDAEKNAERKRWQQEYNLALLFKE